MKMKGNTVLTNVCHGLWVQVVEVKELCEKELRLQAKELPFGVYFLHQTDNLVDFC
jgi:hypothetical protein